MKNLFMMLALFGSISAHAKTLKVSCENKNTRKSIEMISEIKNGNTPEAIKSLTVNGDEIRTYKDISKMPFYNNGDISLTVQFGNKLYSTAEFSLKKCNDDFEATGTANVKEYVGGFTGLMPSQMTCTCSLQ